MQKRANATMGAGLHGIISLNPKVFLTINESVRDTPSRILLGHCTFDINRYAHSGILLKALAE